jgi:hypothetical protein
VDTAWGRRRKSPPSAALPGVVENQIERAGSRNAAFCSLPNVTVVFEPKWPEPVIWFSARRLQAEALFCRLIDITRTRGKRTTKQQAAQLGDRHLHLGRITGSWLGNMLWANPKTELAWMCI